MTTEATIEQLKQARTEGAMVIDVRDPDEYAEGHVPGARSLPLSDLPARTREVPQGQVGYLVYQRRRAQ